MILLLFVPLSMSAAEGQAGRVKGSTAKPPIVEGPAETSLTAISQDLPKTVDGERVYKGKELDKKVVIQKKPEPKYTKEARKHKISGTVVLRCVFASNGQVTHIQVVHALSYGLTDRATEAAQGIKFEPAMKDGKPVSMWIQLEYNFNLH
jgi:TonB family protein